ncbi:hypothetical protein MAH1_37100 [Sessilibacter sp. MAH1]
MKLNIGILIAVIIVSAGLWQADIANDQSKAIKISENMRHIMTENVVINHK